MSETKSQNTTWHLLRGYKPRVQATGRPFSIWLCAVLCLRPTYGLVA